MYFLTATDRFYILLASGVCIWTTVVILICVLVPKCWIYEKIRKRQMERTGSVELLNFQGLDTAGLSEWTQAVCVQTEMDTNLNRLQRWKSLRKIQQKAMRNSSVASKDSGRDSIESNTTNSSRKGSVESSMSQKVCSYVFLTLELADSDSQLLIQVEGAAGLQVRIYGNNTCDPSVSVLVERIRSTLRGKTRQRIANFVTQIIPHCQHPQFRQTFSLSLQQQPVKEHHLVVTVEDNDRLAGIRTLGTTRISLGDLVQALTNGKAQVIRELTPLVEKDKGDVLIGLSFLPTSQRIAVQLSQVRNFSTSRIGKWKIFARIFLLNENCKVLKRCKTKILDLASESSFDENFSLYAAIEQWDKLTLLVVCHGFQQQPDSGNGSGSRSGSSAEVQSGTSAFGFVAFGKQVAIASQRIHWNSALNNPRNNIAQWHSLF